MAKELFCSVDDLKRYSILDGNVDADKLLQWVELAQNTHIQNYLGTDLFVRLKAGITAADLTAGETSLINNYVKPMTIHWALSIIFKFLPVTASNKGLYKHTAENSETLSKEEANGLVQEHVNFAQFHTREFISYMCYNASSFPEYDTNTNEETRPDKKSNFNGWVL